MADLQATRDFFGPRAAGWDDKFPDDEPAYKGAVAELRIPPGATALDAGSGTGRAIPIMQRAVGRGGRVVAVDATPEMVSTAKRKGRAGGLIVGDVTRLPLPDRSVDAILAAGLLPHLEDAGGALDELARVTRVGGRLGLFHPIGRVALAARHGDAPHPGDVRAPDVITALLAEHGWEAELVDDGPDRYLVVARRNGSEA
ncbi:MAG TPA: class I SAM-dependent methyltransferase [Acidimicrobiales bacterium]|nr:class I SAM-dependent methyltransferase [Acidimicrobiales bacterium]